MGNVDFKMCTQEYEDGSLFHGQCERGKFSGKGKMVWCKKEGDRVAETYDGFYKDGLMHGQGVYTHSDKSRYMGQYRLNVREGYGVFTFHDGSLYEGQWKADKPHGDGRVIYPGGEIVDTTFTTGQQDMGEAIADRSKLDLGASPMKSLVNKSEESRRLALTGSVNANASKFGPPKPPTMPALASPFENPAMMDVDRLGALTDVHGMSLPTLPSLAPLPALEQHPQHLALPGGPGMLALPPGPPALDSIAGAPGMLALPPGHAALTNASSVPPPPPPLMAGMPAIPPTSQHPDARRLPMLPPTAPLALGNVPPPPPPRPFGGTQKKMSAVPRPPNAVPRPPPMRN